MKKFIEKFGAFLDDKASTNPIKTFTLIGMIAGAFLFIFVGVDLIITDTLFGISPILGVVYLFVTLGGLIGLIFGINEL